MHRYILPLLIHSFLKCVCVCVGVNVNISGFYFLIRLSAMVFPISHLPWPSTRSRKSLPSGPKVEPYGCILYSKCVLCVLACVLLYRRTPRNHLWVPFKPHHIDYQPPVITSIAHVDFTSRDTNLCFHADAGNAHLLSVIWMQMETGLVSWFEQHVSMNRNSFRLKIRLGERREV